MNKTQNKMRFNIEAHDTGNPVDVD